MRLHCLFTFAIFYIATVHMLTYMHSDNSHVISGEMMDAIVIKTTLEWVADKSAPASAAFCSLLNSKIDWRPAKKMGTYICGSRKNPSNGAQVRCASYIVFEFVNTAN